LEQPLRWLEDGRLRAELRTGAGARLFSEVLGCGK